MTTTIAEARATLRDHAASFRDYWSLAERLADDIDAGRLPRPRRQGERVAAEEADLAAWLGIPADLLWPPMEDGRG